MAHLTTLELMNSYEALFCSLFGLNNYKRWVNLKETTAAKSESDFVSHLLDAAEQVYKDDIVDTVDDTLGRDIKENQVTFPGPQAVIFDDTFTGLNDDEVVSASGDDIYFEDNDEYEGENDDGQIVEDEQIAECVGGAVGPQLVAADGGNGNMEEFLQQSDDNSDERKHACPECGKLFRVKDGMIRHYNLIHTSPKEHRCNYCPAVFTCRPDRLDHEQTQHANVVKSYKCDFCEKRFTMKHHVRRHQKSVHFNVKDETCEHCGMKFALSSHLSRHIATVHLGIKRFGCDVCGQKFSTKSAMQDHKYRKHLAGTLTVGADSSLLPVTYIPS